MAETHRPKDKRPYVVVDASFVLSPLLNYNNPQAFLVYANYLLNVRKARVRLMSLIKAEIKKKMSGCEHAKDSRVLWGLEKLDKLEGNNLMLEEEERELFFTLVNRVKIIDMAMNKAPGYRGLSYEDSSLCAYALLKSRKGDVIMATRDAELVKVNSRIFDIAHPLFVSQGYPDSKLRYASSYQRLEHLLENRSFYFGE
ncbi:MAG: hypothetical protein AABX11_05780 [Nanoarchaeota archaeon]